MRATPQARGCTDDQLARMLLGAMRSGLEADQFVAALRALVEAADTEERRIMNDVAKAVEEGRPDAEAVLSAAEGRRATSSRALLCLALRRRPLTSRRRCSCCSQQKGRQTKEQRRFVWLMFRFHVTCRREARNRVVKLADMAEKIAAAEKKA